MEQKRKGSEMSVERNSAHALSQRMLENSMDCLASYRDSLRSNMSSVRKEIMETFAQQIALLRARETELLRQLEIEVKIKENQLDAQQKDLYKLIKQCQSPETTANDAVDIVDTLSHLDISSKGCGTLYFDKDLVAFRTAIGQFGNIKFEISKNQKFTGETLPMNYEDYEDEVTMAHKSVHFISRQPAVTASPEQMESIRKWLSHIPGRELTQEELFKLVPEDRTDSEETNSICSSFDIIPSVPQVPTKPQQFNITWPNLSNNAVKKESTQEPLYKFTSEFLKTLNSDAACWLLGQASSSSSDKPFSQLVHAAKYEFQNVMQNICDSNYADWYLPSCSTEPEKTASSKNEQDGEVKDSQKKPATYPEVDEALAKNLENLAIFSVRSGGGGMDKIALPVTNQDVDAAVNGDQNAKKKLIAFGHHLWTVMHK